MGLIMLTVHKLRMYYRFLRLKLHGHVLYKKKFEVS